MDKDGWTFLCACAPFTGGLFCARERDDLTENDIVASTFYLWHEANPDPVARWGIYNTVVNWRAQSMATIKPTGKKRITVAIGTRGQYFEVEPESRNEREGVISGRPGPLRRLVAIDDELIAIGMGRTVLRRRGLGIWDEIGPGSLDSDAGQIVGFEGIDGRSLDDFYVAGWGGEIWHRENGTWSQIDSPTNMNLNALTYASDGKIYAVGDNGIVVIGANGSWELMESNRPENLQDVVAFEGEVFVVTDFKILRLTDDGLAPEDRFANNDRPTSCLSLLKAQDGVVSMGPKDLFRFTGKLWQRIL